MARLILVRHGAAANKAQGADDRERPLTPAGRADISALTRRLGAEGVDSATHVLCSPSRRTRETLELLLPHAISVDSNPALYLGDGPALLKLLRYIEVPAKSVMMVGHNPGMQQLAVELAGGPATQSGRALAEEFPAAAAAVFDVAGPWARLGLDGVRLVAFYPPQSSGSEV